MSKLFLFMLTSLDGYYEGPNHDISWHNVDAEFNEFAIQQTGEVGTLLFGRKTYEGMASYWPTEAAKRDDPVVAGLMNNLPKVVFSRTLDKVSWNNSRLVKENIEEEVSNLKQQAGKDIAIYGSSDLAVTLTHMGLVDEYRIMVVPVALGDGKPLFIGLDGRIKLELVSTRVFRSGNVLLTYRPGRK